MKPSKDISRLIEIMAALRTPGTGCPWDLEQNFASIAPYTIEEAYEVAEAIERGDMEDLREELGDLLLQVVFHARMAQEVNAFDFGDIVEAITTKLVRRHPHVFSQARDLDPDAVKKLWGEIKAQEKQERQGRRREAGLPDEEAGLLAGVNAALPALPRAVALQEKAGTVGFDWNDAHAVLAKIREEVTEVEDALGHGDTAHIAEEIGDLLFAVANLARHAAVDPEKALRAANAKFVRRFGAIEKHLAQNGKTLAESSLDEMEGLWIQAKQAERHKTDAPED